MSSTQESPIGLGRKGERVAKTPMRRLPPSRGGRTVGDQPSCRTSEKPQINHRWENSSMPRNASAFRYSGSNTIRARNDGTNPLCLGIPNFVGNSLRIRAMTLVSIIWLSTIRSKSVMMKKKTIG